ncbi:MAG TPA: YdeI/OmpD-associated family protein [Solirubrobacter sp.]|nr:YdeI/OmpD-associated family protein [Solirubrobacter sp.]
MTERAFASVGEFETWLEEHHAAVDGLWLRIAKKASGVPSVTAAEALEVALCFGWIDGQRRPLDETHFLQKYTPRRARSKWSKRNVGLVEALIAAGRMRPAGLAEVERAKADGRWDGAYASASTIEVPPDLQAELDARPQAAAFFATLKGNNRYSILYRLHDAKRPETRARRLREFVAMLERGETLY